MQTRVCRRTSEAGTTTFGYVVLATVLLVPALIAYGVTSYFRLTPATAALRDSVLNSVPCKYDNRISLNIGPLTVGAAKVGLAFVDMPVEARKAIQAVSGADVSVYRMHRSVQDVDVSQLLVRTDSEMKKKGWSKIVRVSKGEDLVAVYMPETSLKKSLKCCVLVWHDTDLVVAGGRADPRPLIELASSQIKELNF